MATKQVHFMKQRFPIFLESFQYIKVITIFKIDLNLPESSHDISQAKLLNLISIFFFYTINENFKYESIHFY